MPIVVPVVAIDSTVDLLMVAAYIVHTYSTKAIARSSKRFSSSSKGQKAEQRLARVSAGDSSTIPGIAGYLERSRPAD